MKHPLPFPLLLLSSCFTLPQFRSFRGFVPQRIKFVSPPIAKHNSTRHQEVVCKSHQEVQGRFGDTFAVKHRVQSSISVCRPMRYSAPGCLLASSCDRRTFHVETACFSFVQTPCKIKAYMVPFSKDTLTLLEHFH